MNTNITSAVEIESMRFAAQREVFLSHRCALCAPFIGQKQIFWSVTTQRNSQSTSRKLSVSMLDRFFTYPTAHKSRSAPCDAGLSFAVYGYGENVMLSILQYLARWLSHTLATVPRARPFHFRLFVVPTSLVRLSSFSSVRSFRSVIIMVEFDTDMLFTMLYGLVALYNAAIFGNLAEVCDLSALCPSRAKAALAFAVLVFIISAIMFGGMMLRLSFLDRVHMLATPVLFALNTVVAATGISPRLVGRESPVSSQLAWWSETICFILVIIAFLDLSRPAPAKPGLETTMAPEPEMNHTSPTPQGPVQYQPAVSPTGTAPEV
ncbi:hypothetical protein BWQ96_07222 [Gracilariopsis chorda]|uniref:Uncharacterized protein n=1 Tax=Gracilariopsis chorda TaxID=448386 RepID=A0A2V3ILR6_9FLOR|nr:hypothetical protein BWQ96_07222 [Gracilariopsis chorda]|eukprot:PXF43025.1 hypothetical protein BWQ96_07222 [Gracilariopsis chorda]